MKRGLVLIVSLLFLLAACAQPVVDITIEEPVPAEDVMEAKEAVEEAPAPVNGQLIFNGNGSVEMAIDGKNRVIEVLYVTEQGDACLISVDGVTGFINERQTKDINGVRIYVKDVIIFHSEPNNFTCEIIF